MASVAIEVQEQGLERALRSIERVTGWDQFELLDIVGRLIQLQTRRRIETEKTAPDGTPWPENRNQTPTLYASGALHNSIDYRATLSAITVGSPLIYAAIHHFGGVIKPKKAKALSFMAGGDRVFAKSVTIPARPYLGLSPDNVDEIEGVVGEFIEGLLQ